MKTLKESLFNDNVKSQIPVNLKSTQSLIEKLLLKNRLSKEGSDSFYISNVSKNEFRLDLKRKIYKKIDNGPGGFYNEEVRIIELILFFVEKDTYITTTHEMFINFDVYPIDERSFSSTGWLITGPHRKLHYDTDVRALIDELIKYYDKAGEFLKSKELNSELLKSSAYRQIGKLTPRQNQQVTQKAAYYIGITK